MLVGHGVGYTGVMPVEHVVQYGAGDGLYVQGHCSVIVDVVRYVVVYVDPPDGYVDVPGHTVVYVVYPVVG
jgi:hypothetical protein